jgi:spindle assembly abnormal protein 6
MEAFIDYQKRNAIKIIFPPFQFTVLQSSHGLQTAQKFAITVETVEFEKNLLQIRLTDACNQARIYICTIDAQMYDRIRFEQSLNVSFQGFRDHLVRILDSCKREEL